MTDQQGEEEVGIPASSPRRFTRRQVAAGITVGAAVASAAAWAAPEILTASPADATALSGSQGTSPGSGTTPTTPTTPGQGTTPGNPNGTGTGGNPNGTGGNGAGNPNGTAGNGGSEPTLLAGGSTSSGSGTPLAYTGVDIERDLAIGGALIAGGWAITRWSSRTAPSEDIANN